MIGTLPLDQIEPRHIADVLRPIWLAKAETAGRVKQRMHAVMAWGWAHGHCRANPVDVAHLLLAQQPTKAVRTQHQPAMPWRALPEFIAKHLHRPGQIDVSRALLRFIILSACRSGEARRMRWEEMDLEGAIWTVPAERMKTQVIHRVPTTPSSLMTQPS